MIEIEMRLYCGQVKFDFDGKTASDGGLYYGAVYQFETKEKNISQFRNEVKSDFI